MKKILHVDFSGPYTEGMTYQENLLPREFVPLGYEVVFWSTDFQWDKNSWKKVEKFRKKMQDGVTLERFSYQSFVFDLFTLSIRKVNNIYKKLEQEQPDIIMLHDFQTVATLEICQYIKKHPEVYLVMDSHSDANNSAKTFLVKYILHGIFYRYLANRVKKYVQKIYYISTETKDFLVERYKLPSKKMEFLPLGGIVLNDADYGTIREKNRKQYGIEDKDVLFLHSGKLTSGKRTLQLLKAFQDNIARESKLFIVGDAEGDISSGIKEAVQKDHRIKYLGWKNGDELYELLCAADIYVQPGTQSATLQNSICCRCAVIVYPHKNYVEGLIENNGIFVKSVKELTRAIEIMTNDSEKREQYVSSSKHIALQKLDYAMQAKRIEEGFRRFESI